MAVEVEMKTKSKAELKAAIWKCFAEMDRMHAEIAETGARTDRLHEETQAILKELKARFRC